MTRTVDEPAATWPPGGGEMGALMRATDWSKTRLGPTETWPQSLRTMLGAALGTRFPMALWWGPDLVQLYNDGYRPILREKHPAALGAPARESWPEIWDAVGPLVDQVMSGGPAVYIEDFQLFISNGAMAEETYFTFSYSAAPGDDGRIAGMLTTALETTAKVQADRQIRVRHEVASRAAAARSEREVYGIAAEVLAADELDVPFVLLYVRDEADGLARLIALGGWRGASPPPASVALDDGGGSAWPLAEAARRGREVIVEDLAGKVGALAAGSWGGRPERAIVLPLHRAGSAAPPAFLVAGLSPHRELDDRYRGFFDATAAQVASSVAAARVNEDERRRAAALAELDRAKTAFFANISHELRTPLTLMLGPVEDALATPDRTLAGDALAMVHRNTLRLHRLVNSLLDFARSEAGKVEASYQATDLAAMTAELASAFRSAVDDAGLRYEIACETLPEAIYVDGDLWEKIVLNLLSNALKFTFAGSIRVAVRWRGDRAELEVADTGTGIPPQELPRLFERFHRVEGARSRSHEGSGIGLALTHELVRLHGGTIAVSSKPGAGTTFTVAIPRGSSHLPADKIVDDGAPAQGGRRSNPYLAEALRWRGPAPRPTPTSAPASVAPGMTDAAPRRPGADQLRGMRVLVVDDNADLREYIARLLGDHFQVETAADGQDGLEAARRRPPALILSDVMMPRLDGFGLLRAIRAEPGLGKIPFILLSARAGEEATVDGLDAGADDYLIKPFAARELLARVRTHLTLAQQRDALAKAKDDAEAANKELEAFSYSVAHDLRGPLRSIDGFSQALLEDCADRLDADGKRYLSFVRESAQHMAQLIDDLLSLSRVTRSELSPTDVDLSALARQSISRLRRAHPDRRVDVVIEDGLHADGDPRLLTVVFENLVGNAWKFTGRQPDARLEVGATTVDGARTFFVRDNGAGFDMSFVNKLFGVFQRLHAVSEFEGTGVGLATVQRVISRHGGKVWAEAAVDRGATFYFTLPSSRSATSPTPGESSPP